MSNQRLSSRYASSIFQLASESNKIEEVLTDIKLIAASISGSNDLKSLLKSPIIKADDKNSILNKIFSGKVNELTSKFLSLLISKGRESYLAEICVSFIEEYNATNKIADITLITAIEATDKIVAEVTSLLTKSGNFSNVVIKKEVDPSIIGGFILKMDDQLLDNSVQRKLQIVKKELQK
ncbi:MAG: ATP synthase F1 subunit delta [Chitinophagales bacterium]